MAYRRSALMQERLANNRDRILLATRRLVARGGFREASMSSVAAVAGLSTGALYRYFPSKAQLFVELLTQAVDREIAILRLIAERPDPAAARLAAAVRSYAARALQGPQLAYAFIAEPVDPEVDAARILCRRAFGEVFATILRAGIASGEFADQNVAVSSAAIVGAFTEALIGPAAAPAVEHGDPRGMVEAICGFCVRAVTGGAGGLADAARPDRDHPASSSKGIHS